MYSEKKTQIRAREQRADIGKNNDSYLPGQETKDNFKQIIK
jgi:hypothetical protein